MQAAVREMEEESGVTVTDAALKGWLTFTFEGKGEVLEVYVLAASQYSGKVAESEEALPEWHSVEDIPFDRLWADDKFWLPLLLAGKRFRGSFHFQDHATLLSHKLVELAEGEALGVDAHTDLLVHTVQGAITS